MRMDSKDAVVEIADYDYPHPQGNDSVRETIALFSSNDFHGYAFPVELTDQETKEKYLKGGIEYFSTIIDIVRNQWKEKFIWIDGGDHSSGGFEFSLSNGKIMTDFFNFKNLTASTIGNHDFNYGIDFLKNYMSNSTFDYLVANIRNKTTQEYEFLPKQLRTKIYQVGKVKLGIIGLTHNKVANGNIKISEGIEFLKYKDTIINLSKELKSQGADAIILLSHFGPRCSNEKGFEDRFKLRMRNSNLVQPKCTNFDGILQLLDEIPQGTIHAMIGAHVHEITHNWFNGIPIMSSTGPEYANVMYLHFNKYDGRLLFDEVEIEGPIPVCSKIYSKKKKCDHVKKEKYNADELGRLTRYSFHNVLVEPDPLLGELVQPWKDKLKPYKEKICYNELYFRVNIRGENTLQNVVADAIKKVKNADISVINVESFRARWHPGDLTYVDMFNMFPFDNLICSFEMTGAEVIRMLSDIVNDVRFYITSGLMVTYARNPNKFIEAKLLDGKRNSEIDLNKTYLIASLDYLIAGNVEFARVLKWYKLRRFSCFNEIRDVVKNYLKELKVLKENSFIDPEHPRIRFISE